VKKRLNKIFEITWLSICLASTIAAAYYFINYGLKQIKPLLIIIPVSAFFYYSRRQRAKKIEDR
tara:strand:+ start:830 stop:1021 length:192 start_codon:yes stop_codon:yes gene_type:complete